MNKAIETKFFKAFTSGGVFSKCLEYLHYKHQLSGQKVELPPPLLEYYNETLPMTIITESKMFDSSVIEYIDSPLIDEIESNITECKSPEDRTRYIYTLLAPFKEYSDIFNPISVLKELRLNIEQSKSNIEYYSKRYMDAVEKEDNIDACYEYIESKNRDIDHVNDTSKRLKELSQIYKYENESVEAYFTLFCIIINKYAMRLDAILLTFGIDLLQTQRECGIYLIEKRNIVSIYQYIGSIELTKKYIDNLPNVNDLILPDELNTSLAQTFFKKAIEANLMKQEGCCYKWSGTDSLLVYMLDKVYKSGSFPEAALGNLFGKQRLSNARGKLYNIKGNKKSGRPMGCPIGYEKIDLLFV